MSIKLKIPDSVVCSDCGSELVWWIVMSHEDKGFAVEVEGCKRCRGSSLEAMHMKDKIIQDQSYRIRDLEAQLGASQKRKCCWCGHVFPADHPKSCPHCLHPATVEANAFEARVSYEPNWPWR